MPVKHKAYPVRTFFLPKTLSYWLRLCYCGAGFPILMPTSMLTVRVADFIKPAVYKRVWLVRNSNMQSTVECQSCASPATWSNNFKSEHKCLLKIRNKALIQLSDVTSYMKNIFIGLSVKFWMFLIKIKQDFLLGFHMYSLILALKSTNVID